MLKSGHLILLIKTQKSGKLIFGTIIGSVLVLLLVLARVELRKHAIIIEEYTAYGLLTRADKLLNQNKNEEALNLIRQAIGLNPHDAEAYNHMGVMMFKMGKYEDAFYYYKQSIKIHPSYHAYCNLGILLHAMKRNDEAIDADRKAIEIYPNGIDAHANLGLYLFYQGNIVEAEEQLKIALQKNPALPVAHVILGLILIQQNDLNGAILHLHLAIQFRPDLYEAYLALGRIAISQGNLDLAVKYYKDVLRIKPDSEIARNELANILEFKKNPAVH